MVSLRSSFRAAHLVMWSSPLLLLVLVFTLTNASNVPVTTTSTPSISHPTTIAPPTSTTTASTTRRTTTIPPATTTTTHAPVVVSSGGPYATTTSSIVRSIALAPNKGVSSGALGGALSTALPVADVPLEGPGSWAITTSAPALAVLSCNGSNRAVTTRVTILSHQSCQLEITSTDPEVSLTWQLTPIQ